MALPDYALTTLSHVKNRAGILDATTTFDTFLERAIMYATSMIEQACNGLRFKTGTHTNEVIDIEDGQQTIYLKHFPVTSLTSLQYNVGPVGTPSWTTELVDNYVLLDDGALGRLRLYSGYSGPKAIRVTYVAGYLIDWTNEFTATHTLPFEITDLCERIALALFNKRTDEGKSSQASQESSVTWEKVKISDEDKEMLKPYARPRFA